jgi:tetratricopeptide (TPR) repeat protein
MADKNQDMESHEVVIAKAKDFWEKYSKPLMIVSLVIILAVGGWYGYKKYVSEPKETKATADLSKAEYYYRVDSVNLALNGDGQNMGLLKVIDKYGGTDAGNLACFYAGSCYIKLDDNANAVKYLKKFSTSSKPLQARAYKLMADAYADMGQNDNALEYYKKSGHYFEKDMASSAEALFDGAYFADRVMKNSKEAIELYKEVKQKFPQSQQALQAETYLAQLGVYNAE